MTVILFPLSLAKGVPVLFLPQHVTDNSLDDHGVGRGEVFLFMRARNLVAVFLSEPVQAADGWLFLVVVPKVENLGDSAVFPRLQPDLGAGGLFRGVRQCLPGRVCR